LSRTFEFVALNGKTNYGTEQQDSKTYGDAFHLFSPTDERWNPLPGAQRRNGVKGCSQEDHFDKELVAGCPGVAWHSLYLVCQRGSAF
jgi:hypothetical protein